MNPIRLAPHPLRVTVSKAQLAGLLLSVGLAIAPSAFAQKTDVRGVTRTSFQGWQGALLMESKDALPRAVLVPGVGARILSYGLRDENLLWTNPNAAGRIFKSGEPPFEPGGFVCAIGPESARLPDHPHTLLGEYSWSGKKRSLISLQGAKDETAGVEMEKDIAFDPATGELGFVHRIKNTSDRDAAYCLWHRIACKPGGFALFPLNKKSRFPKGWSIRADDNDRIRYESTAPESGAVRILDGVLVAQTTGSATKIGADSDAQWLAYVLGRTLFVVHFPHYSGAVYSEGGNSVLVAWDGTRTELQPMSPEARLRSRKSYEFPIKWSLVELPTEITTHEQAAALAATIPSSPFL